MTPSCAGNGNNHVITFQRFGLASRDRWESVAAHASLSSREDVQCSLVAIGHCGVQSNARMSHVLCIFLNNCVSFSVPCSCLADFLWPLCSVTSIVLTRMREHVACVNVLILPLRACFHFLRMRRCSVTRDAFVFFLFRFELSVC